MKPAFAFLLLLMITSNALARSPVYPWKKIDRVAIGKLFPQSIPMHLEGEVGYVNLPVGEQEDLDEAWFLLDTGTTSSTIDKRLVPETEEAGQVEPDSTSTPVISLNSQAAAHNYQPELFHFFKPERNANFHVQDYTNIKGSIRQEGIIGTDFLSEHPHAFDFAAQKLRRSEASQPLDSKVLQDAGLTALSTRGFFVKDLSKLVNVGSAKAPDVPTIPIKIGNQTFLAQIDSGYDDRKHRFSININQAMKSALDQAGIALIPEPGLNASLSTCVPGVMDQVTAFRLPEGAFFSFLNLDNQEVNQYPDIYLFLKVTPEAARVCGGISTWSEPAAQLGSSFLMNMGLIIFDPLTSLVWIPQVDTASNRAD